MLFTLAIIPSIALLIYIYKKDKKEKEPMRLLIKCFIWGIIAIIPILIMETLVEEFLVEICVEGSVVYSFLDGFLVAALSEELFKYLVLKSKTWKNKAFNCTFDGIVYAVFVSLGFATFENVMYVLDGDISTAFLRMFTSVPGHACDAVFMGYFYSLAKKAAVNNDKRKEKKNKRRALLIPIITHGIYDGLILMEEDVAGEDAVIIGALLWIVVVVVQFILAFKLVNKASKNDESFYPEVEDGTFQVV